MKEYMDRFLAALDVYNKERSVSICLEMLERGVVNIEQLYLDVLTPSLNRLVFPEEEQDDMIWKEHVQSAIVRSIIEAAYPYVLAERTKMNRETNDSVVVFCPEEEQHELGARMAADFFTIAGYKTTYLGARTPENTLIRALQSLQPRIIVISVTNSFNLFAAKRTVRAIRDQLDYPVKLLAGGNACSDPDQACEQLGLDGIIQDLREIFNTRWEEKL